MKGKVCGGEIDTVSAFIAKIHHGSERFIYLYNDSFFFIKEE